MTNDRKYQRARKRVKTKKEFYEHLTVYVIMSAFFFLINALTDFGDWWFYWPILGWGLGVMFHYFDVFGLPGVGTMSQEWENKAIRDELDRMDREDRYRNPHKKRLPAQDFDSDDRLDLRELDRQKDRRKWDEDELV